MEVHYMLNQTMCVQKNNNLSDFQKLHGLYLDILSNIMRLDRIVHRLFFVSTLNGLQFYKGKSVIKLIPFLMCSKYKN